MDEYRDRLARAMEQAAVDTTRLAQALGISYQAVRKVLNGGQFGKDNNSAAAAFLKVRSDWLARGEGPMADEGQRLDQEVLEVAEQINRLPPKSREWVLRIARDSIEALRHAAANGVNTKESAEKVPASSKRMMGSR